MIDGVERRKGVTQVLDGRHVLEADRAGDVVHRTLTDDLISAAQNLFFFVADFTDQAQVLI